MKYMFLSIVIFLYITSVWSQEPRVGQAQANPRGPKDGWSTGLFTLYRSQPYKGLKSQLRAFPYIGYRNGGFFVRGPFVGYEHKLNTYFSLSTSLMPNLFSGPFDPEESSKLDGIEERDGTIEGSIGLRVRAKFISINLVHRRDLIGVYNGSNTSLALGSGFPISVLFKSLPFTMLRASVGKRFIDANENFYQYGIYRDEVRTDREYFNPGESINDFYSIFFLMKLSDNWNINLNYVKEFLHKDLQASPIVNEGYIERAFGGLIYTF